MKIYRIDVIDPFEGSCIGWAGSIAEAKKVFREMQLNLNEGASEATISAVEFPTTKAAIIQWLNANLSRDNG